VSTPPFDEWFETKHGGKFDDLASTMSILGAMQFLAAALRDYTTEVVQAGAQTMHNYVGDAFELPSLRGKFPSDLKPAPERAAFPERWPAVVGYEPFEYAERS